MHHYAYNPLHNRVIGDSCYHFKGGDIEIITQVGDSMGSGMQKVPMGNLQKNSQVNSPVPAGSQHLKSCMGGDIILGHIKLINYQIR